jgi:hypothetical protein
MAKTNRIGYRRSTQVGVPGKVRMIYDENIDPESFGDNVDIRRASHVDPGSELSQRALIVLSQQYPQYVLSKYDEENDLYYKIHPDYASKWFADCGPTRGSVLGPFNKRSEALAAEEEWVRKNVI